MVDTFALLRQNLAQNSTYWLQVSQVGYAWFYLRYPSGEEPVQSVWKKGGKTWKATEQTFRLSPSSRPTRFDSACRLQLEASFSSEGVSACRGDVQTENISVVKNVALRRPNTKHICSVALHAWRHWGRRQWRRKDACRSQMTTNKH